MIRLLVGADDVVSQWARERLPYVEDFGPCTTIGVTAGGPLIAAAVYHDFYPEYRSCQISLVSTSPRWAKRGIFQAMLHYPFVQLDCQRLTAVTARSNERAQKLLNGVGFQFEGVMRRGFGDDDMIIFGLLREEAAPWIGEDNGKKLTVTAARA